MIRHDIRTIVCRPASEVTAVLGVRPARWMRGFLGLAVSGQNAYSHDGNHWWRLSELTYDDFGRAMVRFVWRPHAGPSLFAVFTGWLTAERKNDHCVLALHGDTAGGERDVNNEVLAGLVEALQVALTAQAALYAPNQPAER